MAWLWRNEKRNHPLAADCFTQKRKEMKELISHFRKINPNVETSIFMSMHNVNLETVIGYRKGEQTYNFLDDYNVEN